MPTNNTMGINLQGKNIGITFAYKNKESFDSAIKTLNELKLKLLKIVYILIIFIKLSLFYPRGEPK